MAFQFLCPQGHLLQGEESQAGQQCKCPYCGTLFLVPQPIPAPGGPALGPGPAEPPPQQPESPWAFAPPEPPTAGIQVFRDPFAGPSTEAPGVTELPHGAAQTVVHVLCPSGHSLETPRELLGQDAMCPFCQTVFHLRFEDSVEYREEKAEQEESRVRKAGQTWLYWAIGMAIAIIGALITLAAIAISQS